MSPSYLNLVGSSSVFLLKSPVFKSANLVVAGLFNRRMGLLSSDKQGAVGKSQTDSSGMAGMVHLGRTHLVRPRLPYHVSLGRCPESPSFCLLGAGGAPVLACRVMPFRRDTAFPTQDCTSIGTAAVVYAARPSWLVRYPPSTLAGSYRHRSRARVNRTRMSLQATATSACFPLRRFWSRVLRYW